MRLAAIDIGSNAARLLISDVISAPLAKPEFLKIALVRVPLRLGFDVFDKGEITPQKATNIIKTIQSYKLLMDVYGVKHLKACATSAMRDARNGQEIIQKVKIETGIEIGIISGQEEASLIYENHFAEGLTPDESYLYIDVGDLCTRRQQSGEAPPGNLGVRLQQEIISRLSLRYAGRGRASQGSDLAIRYIVVVQNCFRKGRAHE